MTSETDWTAPRGVMLGGGDYDRHSELQGGVLELAAGCLERAVRALGARDLGQPFCLADYGAATGKNSVSVMRRIGALFRSALGREPPLVITFCDQTGNDWNALAERLEAAFGSRDDVNTLMSAGSFYGSVLPSCSVDLAWSASSVHWLGRSPALTTAGLWPHPDLPGRGRFVEQAARDWESFLRERARELRPGGQLVVVAAAAGADGRSPADHYLDPVWETLLELERDGELGTSERARMFVPTYFRSAGEYRAPFDDPTLPLELVEYAEAPLPDAIWQVYERTGEPAELARAWVGWLRAFSAPLLGRALDARRDEAQKRAFLDELYRRLEQQIVNEPARARVPWQTALVHAVRSG